MAFVFRNYNLDILCAVLIPRQNIKSYNKSLGMGISDRIAIVGHNGWTASRIIKTLAAHPFQHPIRVLAREGSNVSRLPPTVEISRYNWDSQASLRSALSGIDILMLVDNLSRSRKCLTDQPQIVHRPRRSI